MIRASLGSASIAAVTLCICGGCTLITSGGPYQFDDLDAGHDAGRGRADAGHDAAMDAGRDAAMDAGPPDSGPPDSGPPDSGPPDSGLPDSGPPDSGAFDAGPPSSVPPSSTDPFEGATVGASNMEHPSNMFGDHLGVTEEGGAYQAAFGSAFPNAGDLSYVEFMTATALHVWAVRLYGHEDGYANSRAMRAFELKADPECDGTFFSVASVVFNRNYSEEPDNLASDPKYLELFIQLDPPTTSRCWRAEFAQGFDDGAVPYPGIRVNELDAITDR